jgi:protein-disulfide isomerase-like protein with CxxC motif
MNSDEFMSELILKIDTRIKRVAGRYADLQLREDVEKIIRFAFKSHAAIEAITRTVPDEVDESLERVARIIAPHHCEGLSDTVRNIARAIREELASHPDEVVRLREALDDADWINAETCIENAEAYIDDESLCDEDGPVDTVVPSGDLYVLIGLAKAAVRARAALRSNQDGE